MTHRFFVSPAAIRAGAVAFDAATAHQLRDVLRIGRGEDVVVLDDQGWEYQVRVETFERGSATGKVLSKRLATGEPRTKIVLFQSILKGGSKFEWVLQKCTEVGVVAFVPMTTARTVPSGEGNERNARWIRIIQEAAEQARRARQPLLNPVVDFPKAVRQAKGLSLIPWEGETSRSLREVLRDRLPASSNVFSVNVFIGPEGGFTEAEIDQASAAGVLPITLGPRILRAETAGLVAASAILYEQGDLGG